MLPRADRLHQRADPLGLHRLMFGGHGPDGAAAEQPHGPVGPSPRGVVDERGGLGHPVAGEDRAPNHKRAVAAQVIDGLYPAALRPAGLLTRRHSAIRSAMPLVDPYLLA